MRRLFAEINSPSKFLTGFITTGRKTPSFRLGRMSRIFLVPIGRKSIVVVLNTITFVSFIYMSKTRLPDLLHQNSPNLICILYYICTNAALPCAMIMLVIISYRLRCMTPQEMVLCRQLYAWIAGKFSFVKKSKITQ